MIKKYIGILQLRFEMYCQFINIPIGFKKKTKQKKIMNTVMTVDRLKSLELKNFFYWFLFLEIKIIFENYKTASFHYYYYYYYYGIGIDKKQQLYIIKKMIIIAIRETYYIFCCRNRKLG